MVAVLSGCTTMQEIDQLGIGRTAGLGAGGRRPGEAEADDEHATTLEESTARKGLGGGRVGHGGAHGVAHGLAHGVAPGASAAGRGTRA